MLKFKRGEHIVLDHGNGMRGIISEVVPAGALPRSVKHTARWRRSVESYVVTVLAPRTIEIRGCGGSKTGHTIACRRIWPAPESLAPLGDPLTARGAYV